MRNGSSSNPVDEEFEKKVKRSITSQQGANLLEGNQYNFRAKRIESYTELTSRRINFNMLSLILTL